MAHGFFPLYCKSWDCESCRRFKKKTVTKFIRSHFVSNSLYMMTFTYKHNLPPLSVWRNVGKTWNRWRTRAVQKYGSFNYIKIVETHKVSPYPHFHVLIDKFIPITWISKTLVKLGFGWNFQSQRISQKGAVAYVSKYLAKEWPNEQGKKYRKEAKTRIVSSSRALGPVFITTSDWSLIQKFPNEKIASVWQKSIVDHLDKLDWEYDITLLYYSGIVIETFIASTNTLYLEPDWIGLQSYRG